MLIFYECYSIFYDFFFCRQAIKEGTTSGEDHDGSCHSSRISNKSEKNMADFEGEEFISDEELAQINARSQYNSHQMQQHLSHLASMYHTHLPHGKIL